jgi:hypothetical protein
VRRKLSEAKSRFIGKEPRGRLGVSQLRSTLHGPRSRDNRYSACARLTHSLLCLGLFYNTESRRKRTRWPGIGGCLSKRRAYDEKVLSGRAMARGLLTCTAENQAKTDRDQVTICKAFHFTFSRGWSGSLPRPLQCRVSEISAICLAKCQTDKFDAERPSPDRGSSDGCQVAREPATPWAAPRACCPRLAHPQRGARNGRLPSAAVARHPGTRRCYRPGRCTRQRCRRGCCR